MSDTTSRIVISDDSKALLLCKRANILHILLEVEFADDDIMKGWLPCFHSSVHFFLQKDPALKELAVTWEVFEKNVERQGEGAFYQLLREVAISQDWRRVLQNQAWFDLSRSKPGPATSQQTFLPRPDEKARAIAAALNSWNAPFRGKAASVLLKTISTYLDKRRDVYARYSTIVNSSGTGKSRMVDQLSMEIVTIPMCLRGLDTKGFPPADGVLCNWLNTFKGLKDKQVAAEKLHTFLWSLFSVTSKHLNALLPRLEGPKFKALSDYTENRASELSQLDLISLSKERQEILAEAFRDCMTREQTFETTNEYRKRFFQEVVEMTSTHTPPLTDSLLVQATEALTRIVDPGGLLASNSEGPRRPLVILAFDEGHMLTDIVTDMETGQSLLSELRRALRVITRYPIFCLLLSTAAKFRVFYPEVRSDPSLRVVTRIPPELHPICEISFDDLAFPAIEDTVRLDEVIQDRWMSHLGRPLFGSRFDAIAKNEDGHLRLDELMLFAKAKLLDGRTELKDGNDLGTLACLCVRFALDFDLADEYGRKMAQTQIERHMRICITATAGLDKLITIAGSEPFLAEAACELISRSRIGAVRHLAKNSNLNCIDRGQRGEQVAALLIMGARDAAFTRTKSRAVSVDDFMKALLPVSQYEKLEFARPQFWQDGKDKPFSEAFEGYSTWFNHVIKVQHTDMINTQHLWKFITRGAMVLCVDNQRGVDIVLPVCKTEEKLSERTVTAILIQVKTDKSFANVDKTLFDGMNPFRVGLFDAVNANPLPVIRLVFALASHTAAVVFPEVPDRKNHPDKFTAYDIWCAGLSPDTFRDIDDDLECYNSLLLRSLQPHDAYDLKEVKDKYRDEDTAVDRGAQRRRVVPLWVSGEVHNYIHDPANYSNPAPSMVSEN